MSLTRRNMIAGLAASLPLAAEAGVTGSIRPHPRPGWLRSDGSVPGAAILAESGLAALTGFALRDLSSGEMLAEHRPGAAIPPASVSKVLTTLYGIDALGTDYRFRTRVAVTGAIIGGRLQGDLYLIGGGDPQMDTDGLADLAVKLAGAGIRRVDGNAYIYSAALPFQRSIDPTQPVHAGYNPSISGTNLNFNRVRFEWKPGGKGETLTTLTARGTRYDPQVSSVGLELADRRAPIFDYRSFNGRDVWTVAAPALRGKGGRWLPVRCPELYAAEVFGIVAAQAGVTVPPLQPAATLPEGLVTMAAVDSAPLDHIARSMLRWSTNLTAEVIGLRACQAQGGQPGAVADSARAMTDWLRARHGESATHFTNHSGLTDETRISAQQMVEVLGRAAGGPMPGLLREFKVLDERGNLADTGGAEVVAKTGTLHFTRGLAGYIRGARGQRLAFAIFAADLDARARHAGLDRPPGSRRWRGLAKRQEQALLRSWISHYAQA